MPDWLESNYGRLHKMLAHLTYDRVEMIGTHGRGWKVDRPAPTRWTFDPC